jgi:nucleoside phosphorylase
MPFSSPAVDFPRNQRERPIWICFAVPQEAAFLRFHDQPVRILITGMGAAQAQQHLQSALTRATPRLVLSSGFAGGLNPSLNTGTVLFSVDAAFSWTSSLQKSGAQPGAFLCSKRVVCRAAEKRALWQTSHADAVEMESESLRALCRERGIPSATIRVISDTAQEDLPLDFNQLLRPDGRLLYAKLFLGLLRNPGSLPGFLRLQRQTRAAARRLASVLQQAVAEAAHGV